MFDKIKPVKPRVTNNSIIDCEFVGVKNNSPTIEAITSIANGLTENAKAFSKLADALNGSGINIESLLKFGSTD